jgi:hypothetical protein
LALSELVSAGQLAANEDGRLAAWIEPPARDREPNPPFGYVVSFIRFQERGFAAPASRFLRGLCYHYGVELHNFTPNEISHATTFVSVCTPLSRGAAHARYAGAEDAPRGACRQHVDRAAEHAQGALHPLHDDFQQRGVGAGVVLPPQRRRQPPPYSGKVLKERAYSWHHGVSPSSHQAWLDSLLAALKSLADDGLTAGCILANLHHRRIIPLMERPLRIFEMHEDADPVALAQSRLLPDLFPREYAATRARRAIDLRAARNDDETLWAFTMLPVGPLVSGLPPPLALLVRRVSAYFEALPVPRS